MNSKKELLNLSKRVIATSDIETLDIAKSSVVLEVSTCLFIPRRDLSYKEILDTAVTIPINAQEQLDMGRTVSAATLIDFWNQQPKEVRDSVFNRSFKGLPVSEALQRLQSLYSQAHLCFFRGPHFDAAIIEHLAADAGMPSPFEFWKAQCARTAFNVTGSTAEFKKIKQQLAESGDFLPHLSAHDAALDAYVLNQKIIRQIDMETEYERRGK